MPTPPVLLGPEFSPLWQHVSATLDRRGLSDRGWIRLPDGLPAAVRARLKELGRCVPAARRPRPRAAGGYRPR